MSEQEKLKQLCNKVIVEVENKNIATTTQLIDTIVQTFQFYIDDPVHDKSDL